MQASDASCNHVRPGLTSGAAMSLLVLPRPALLHSALAHCPRSPLPFTPSLCVARLLYKFPPHLASRSLQSCGWGVHTQQTDACGPPSHAVAHLVARRAGWDACRTVLRGRCPLPDTPEAPCALTVPAERHAAAADSPLPHTRRHTMWPDVLAELACCDCCIARVHAQCAFWLLLPRELCTIFSPHSAPSHAATHRMAGRTG